MSEEEGSVEHKVKVLKEKERKLKEQQKDLDRARKEVKDELRRAKGTERYGHTGENSRSGGDDTKLDLEYQIVLLKRRLDKFENKEVGRRLQQKRARQNRERKRRMESEIRRVRIEEREREKARKEIVKERE